MSDPKNDNDDPRLAATGIIAGCDLGALALCGVFGHMMGGGFILPAIVIGGAAVWKHGGRRASALPIQRR